VQSHTSRQSDLEIDVDDSASIILGFEGDGKKKLVASLNMDFIRHDTTRKCYAVGKKGTLLWNAISGEVKLFSQDDNHWKSLFKSLPERNYTYTQEIISFFESVESRVLLSTSGEDGVKTVKIIEAIEESSLTKSRVYL
jgi:predicted dehydrogenase